MRIGIIGGGASGMILASKLTNHDVTLIERNNKLGKKLLLTGNGKCNFTNMCFDDLKTIFNNDFAINLYKKYDNLSFMNFFKEIGIVPKIETHKNIQYVYPNSNKSIDVYYCLLDKIKANNVKLEYNSYVKSIKIGSCFNVILDDGRVLKYDRIVLATGGQSYKHTGSDGTGYRLATSLGHNIKATSPGLTSLKFDFANRKIKFSGKCRINATLNYIDSNSSFSEYGEIQFRDNIISGIPVLNLSSIIRRSTSDSKTRKIRLDFSKSFIECYNNCFSIADKDIYEKSSISLDTKRKLVSQLLFDRWQHTKYRHTKDFLCGFLPNEISEVLLNVSDLSNKNILDFKNNDFERLSENIISLELNLSDSMDFNDAQITLGGIDTTQVDNNSLESKIVKGLYFTGEVLDIDGICGGYNLQLAYSSASVVADNI